uniref:Thyroglobulin n=1 Tax=Sphaeramia orbicularis TaxID=375764 RepID=A0A673ASL5_9TELE
MCILIMLFIGDVFCPEYQLDSESLSQCELLRGVAVAKQQDHIPHCTEDGRFRHVQCSVQGQCWCVDAEGQEVIGTRTDNSAPHCPSPCQLQSVLRCSPSGLFEPVQCDSSRGQCWCVDQDGMELYGTRQNGRPQTCPGSCEVRSRRLLHSSGSGSHPQCSGDGSFLPVQCKFINMTDRMEINLLEAFNSFPEAFESFSNFRKFFPMVSSYCFCADSRGREMHNTGLELLLSNVYDSAFSGLRSGRSFTQSNIYRVLQRRTLGVRFALTGQFRCPSPCEEERRAATEASSVFVPSCESGGSFSSRQCQQGGQCWCVDPTGREIPGTRQLGGSLVCSGLANCPAQRRLALSRLFSGPVDPPQTSSARSSASCQSLLLPLKDLLPIESDPTSFLTHVVQVLDGLFPSVGGALEAFARSSPRRLQENLFGGKFLKNAAAFNFSGAVGDRGALGLDRLSSQDKLQKNQNLVQTVSRALEDSAFISALQNLLMGMKLSVRHCGGFHELQCQGDECWCVDSQGQEVAGSRTTGRRPHCPSRCERERAMALKVKGSLAAGAEIHVPACSEDGEFLALQCVGSRCFCVDTEGKSMAAGPTGGAVTCKTIVNNDLNVAFKLILMLFIILPPGTCSPVLSKVTAFRQEVKNIIAVSNSSYFPLGYGYLLAEGLHLTPEELQIDQSEEELLISDRLLSRSNAALRLAAYSTIQMFAAPQSRSYEPYSPQCDSDGNWRNTQCHHSTGQCWCVDEDGVYIPDSLTRRSVDLPKCKTTNTHWFTTVAVTHQHFYLSSSSCFITAHLHDGRFSVLQTGSAAGWCVNPFTGEIMQTATQSSTGQYTYPSNGSLFMVSSGPSWCRLRDSQCRPDGSFIPLQCDSTSCWCVSVDGQEVGGTRMLRSTGQTPSCDRPLCSAPVITHGALVCQQTDSGLQSCDLICHRGYHNALPVSSFLCETSSGQWSGDDKPLSGACQSKMTWNSDINHSVSLCDDQSVRLQCDGDNMLRLKVRFTAALSDIPNSDLPDLHDISELVCPAGSFSREGACLLCPQGTYQDEEGRDFCNRCPRGSSATGASSVNQCVTECQRRGLRCSDQGNFLSAQPDFLSNRWRCVSREGAELQWTDSNRPLTDEECSGDHLAANHRLCLCTKFMLQSQCELYSTHIKNTHCNTSQQMKMTKGDEFLFDRCVVPVCVLGAEFEQHTMLKAISGVFKTQVFSSKQTSLSDAHLFCQSGCRQDACCDGFILNQNSLNGGSLLCGWLRAPSALMCGDRDWDVIGQGKASRICGAGLSYNEQQRSFVLYIIFKGTVLRSTLSFCPSGCESEPQCSIVDLRDSDSPGFYSCVLFPDSRVCGAYDKPLRRPCRPLLDRAPSNTYSRKVNLSGPVKSFYQRVSFQKMVSYSVRSRVSLTENTALSEGFMECERRCDEDPCCRGIGFVRDTKSPGSYIVCLSLISLGVQTCSDEDQTSWRTQDCRPSVVQTKPDPFGWYQKPVNQWSSFPALCPTFNLPKLKNNVSLDHWTLLADSSVLIDPSLSTYDVIHLSQDIATNQDETRDWCLHGNHIQGCTQSCLTLLESGELITWLPSVTSISIPGHGTLQGVTVETSLGSDRKTVVQFLGVPYARPPVGSLRFTAAQPADWTGSWDASKPRPSCVQPGDVDSAASSEDCLYLNVFSPTGRVPVLVFFYNPSANQSPGLLDGSSLAALGNIVVVTASYRTAALGFLRTGSSGLLGNYGLSDQEAVLRWVDAHISLVGGDNRRVTVGAERQGADISSLHLLSSSSSSSPLFQRMILMGGSVFSPSLSQSASSSRSLAVELAKELGCVTSDPTDDNLMTSCLRATPVQRLNAAQTKLLSVSGPFQSWAPVHQSASQSFHRVDLLVGTSGHDGLISRARRIKDFEALQGRTDGKTAFYEALSRSLGGVKGSGLLKEAAAWFYSLDHSPSPSGYNLFSRALDNATRDLFIICPSLQMAQHWANSKANVYLYHQPATETRY